jgi:hypothetical protein
MELSPSMAELGRLTRQAAWGGGERAVWGWRQVEFQIKACEL